MTHLSAQGERLVERLEETIEQMLLTGQSISTRNIIAHMPDDFRHPTDVTRPEHLRRVYLNAKERQKLIKVAVDRQKSSKASLQAQLARQAAKISALEADIQLLVASHKAVYSAVGEVGGLQAWLRFFETHQAALEGLERLEAIPHPAQPTQI